MNVKESEPKSGNSMAHADSLMFDQKTEMLLIYTGNCNSVLHYECIHKEYELNNEGSLYV